MNEISLDEAIKSANDDEIYGSINIRDAIEAGAEVTTESLPLAIATGYTSIVAIILKAGAKVTIESLPQAIATGYYKIVAAILNAGAEVTTESLSQARATNDKMIINIVEHVYSVNSETSAIDSTSEILANEVQIKDCQLPILPAECLARIGFFATAGNRSLVRDAQAQSIVNRHFQASTNNQDADNENFPVKDNDSRNGCQPP